MEDTFHGAHCYNVYYGNGSTAHMIRANSENEAVEKFRHFNDAGKRGEPVVRIVKVS